MPIIILKAISNLAWIATKVTLAWTKAHVGTEGNEAADQAAKQAAYNDTKKVSVLAPLAHRNHIIDDYFKAQWADRWKHTNTSNTQNCSYPNYKHNPKLSKQYIYQTRPHKIYQNHYKPQSF